MQHKYRQTQMAADAAPEALASLQTRFAGHIRDPRQVAAPDGIEDRRMAIYRDLFFNNIRNRIADLAIEFEMF